MMEQWQTITIIFSLMGILFAAIVYQIAKMFQVSDAERFVKGELMEACLNVVLALFLMAIIIPYFNYISVSYANMVFESKHVSFEPSFQERIDGYISNPFSIAGQRPQVSASEVVTKVLHGENVRGCVERYTQSMIFLYSISMNYGYGIQSSNLEPTGAPTDAWGTLFQNLYQQGLNVYILLIFCIKALAFMDAFGPVLIAMGITLRAFAPTRSAGAFLISMGLGFMLVFPIAYIFMIGNFYQEGSQLCAISGQIEDIAGLNTLEKWGGIAGEITALPMFLFSAANFVRIMGYALSGYAGYLLAGITRTFMTLCIVPLAAFAITMTFININTSVFGGRIAEIGRGLFRLI